MNVAAPSTRKITLGLVGIRRCYHGAESSGAALTPGRAANYTHASRSAGVGAGKAVKIGHGPATVSGFRAVSQVTRPRRSCADTLRQKECGLAPHSFCGA